MLTFKVLMKQATMHPALFVTQCAWNVPPSAIQLELSVCVQGWGRGREDTNNDKRYLLCALNRQLRAKFNGGQVRGWGAGPGSWLQDWQGRGQGRENLYS